MSNETTLHSTMVLASKSVLRILENFLSSDFATHYGTKPALAMAEYEVDMARDIVAIFFGRDLTEDEADMLLTLYAQLKSKHLDNIHASITSG